MMLCAAGADATSCAGKEHRHGHVWHPASVGQRRRATLSRLPTSARPSLKAQSAAMGYLGVAAVVAASAAKPLLTTTTILDSTSAARWT